MSRNKKIEKQVIGKVVNFQRPDEVDPRLQALALQSNCFIIYPESMKNIDDPKVVPTFFISGAPRERVEQFLDQAVPRKVIENNVICIPGDAKPAADYETDLIKAMAEDPGLKDRIIKAMSPEIDYAEIEKSNNGRDLLLTYMEMPKVDQKEFDERYANLKKATEL